MNTILIVIAILTLLSVVSVYMLRYLDGYYAIKSSNIIESGKISNGNGDVVGQYFIIKTIYLNNRIVIKKQRHINH